MGRKTRQEAIDDLTLALLYLTRFNDGEGSHFNEIAWKNYAFDSIERLDKEEFIIDPKRNRGGRYKYAYLTEKGRERARALLKELGAEDYDLYERFEFRTIRPEEAEEAAGVEQICFPPNEACSKEHMVERIAVAADLFLVAIDRESGKIAGFLNGIATDEYSFKDDFFVDAGNHKNDGSNVMLLGLDVLPKYRKKGLARELVYNYCRKEQARGRKRLVLTCLANKVRMYTKFGFRDLGESGSEWGGEKWHEMDIILNYGWSED